MNIVTILCEFFHMGKYIWFCERFKMSGRYSFFHKLRLFIAVLDSFDYLVHVALSFQLPPLFHFVDVECNLFIFSTIGIANSLPNSFLTKRTHPCIYCLKWVQFLTPFVTSNLVTNYIDLVKF